MPGSGWLISILCSHRKRLLSCHQTRMRLSSEQSHKGGYSVPSHFIIGNGQSANLILKLSMGVKFMQDICLLREVRGCPTSDRPEQVQNSVLSV